MTIELRDYQSEMLRGVYEKLQRFRTVLLQSPTGSGKTVLASFMAQGTTRKRKRTMFLCHRRELIEQAEQTFTECDIPVGIIAPGWPGLPSAPVQIASVDTLKSRLDRVYDEPDLIIWDEAHHTAAAGWRKVRERFPQAFHVGLTATPARLDGKGLKDLFDGLVLGPSVRWLIEQGWLARYRAFAPSTPDTSEVHSRAGDFAKEELSKLMDDPKIVGDAVAHYQRLAPGKRAVAFCVDIEHSKHVAAQFAAAGVRAAHLDGGSDRNDRKRIVAAFRRGEIQVLSNVDLFGEGFDLPELDCSILLRPTKSLGVYLQQVGRCLRAAPGKDHALILDHAGNMAVHGLPDDEREWTLEGRKKRPRGTPTVMVRECPTCYAVHAMARQTCPECGCRYEVTGREIEHVDGQLEEIDLEKRRQQRRQEEQRAKTMEELTELGRARGYKRPELWAQHVYMGRKGKGAAFARRKDKGQHVAEAQYSFYMEGR